MRLILLGDFHYSRMEQGTSEMVAARDKAYASMLERFLAEAGEYHISLGDLTHEGLPEELGHITGQIGGSGRRFIHVLGNHDTYSIPKADILGITGGQRYSRIETEEAVLLFLDSTKEMVKDDWGGEIDAEQIEWLQNELERTGDKPALVFAHHPVYDTTRRSTIDKLSIHPDYPIEAILNRKKGPGFYFCGHNHANSIVARDGWHYIQTAACLDVPAVRIVELTNGTFRTELRHMNDPELAQDIAGFNTRMKGFTPVADAHGELSDHELEIPL